METCKQAAPHQKLKKKKKAQEHIFKLRSIPWLSLSGEQAAEVTVQAKMRISNVNWKKLKPVLPLEINASAALTSHWDSTVFY